MGQNGTKKIIMAPLLASRLVLPDVLFLLQDGHARLTLEIPGPFEWEREPGSHGGSFKPKPCLF